MFLHCFAYGCAYASQMLANTTGQKNAATDLAYNLLRHVYQTEMSNQETKIDFVEFFRPRPDIVNPFDY